MGKARSFLFLQGVCSPFFARLADRLVADGHHVHKINFNGGDTVYWGARGAGFFRGKADALPEFFGEIYRKFGITDQLLFGDCRPVHRPAVDFARQSGIRTHVFEEGYFRPYWITLEREGVNAHSRLPRNADWFREAGKKVPHYGKGQAFKSPFRVRAMHDVGYHLANAVNPLFFPGYRTHAPCNALIEYAGYVQRLPMLRFHAPRDKRLVEDLVKSAIPFYFFPLQLNSDAQIRDHSSFDDMEDAMKFVMESFARHASGDARLVIKNHPLDTGRGNFSHIIGRLERHFGMEGRVDYLETGDVGMLLRHARGVITVNSTVGTLSLAQMCPTITLSDPIYNLPGLTYQGPLDNFWADRPVPDAELFRRFRNVVIHTTQINGGFYCRQGIDLAVRNCGRMLQADRSPLEELL